MLNIGVMGFNNNLTTLYTRLLQHQSHIVKDHVRYIGLNKGMTDRWPGLCLDQLFIIDDSRWTIIEHRCDDILFVRECLMRRCYLIEEFAVQRINSDDLISKEFEYII